MNKRLNFMRTCKRWTKEENKIIIDNYPKFGSNINLLGRSKESINMQAIKLGVKRIVESERKPFKDSFGHWIAGLADGEGSFSIYYNKKDKGPKIYPQFILGLKFSEFAKKILQNVQKKIGGRVYIQSENGVPKTISIRIINMRDCIFIRRMFRKYKLKIKENDFKIWSEIIDAKLDEKRNNFENLKNLVMRLSPTKGARRVFFE